MNKDKIEEILKQAKPPSSINEEKKQQLRRELLNSKRFERKLFLNFLFSPKYILAGIAIAIIAVLVIVNFNQQITIDELRAKTNTQYAGLINSANYASFNNDLTLFGTDNSGINLKVDQVLDAKSNNYYLKIYNEKKIEELDELIIRDGNIYRTENPKIKTAGTVSSLANKKMKVFVIDDTISIDRNLMMFQHKDNYTSFNPNSQDNGYLVYNKPVKIDDEVPRYKSKPFYKEVPKEVDLDQYFRTNPIDLAQEIDSAKHVEIIGNEYYDQQEYRLVQITKDIDNNVAAAYEVIIAKLDSISRSDIMIEAIDSITKVKINDHDSLSWSIVEGDSLTSYKELKTIAISTTSGRIEKVKFSILKNDKKINLSEIRFAEQSQVMADTSYFDHKKHGLVLIGKLN